MKRYTKSLDLISAMDEIMWECEIKIKETTPQNNDLYDYLEGCNDIGYCN